MKKFTKLWPLMIMILFVSSISYGQRQKTLKNLDFDKAKLEKQQVLQEELINALIEDQKAIENMTPEGLKKAEELKEEQAKQAAIAEEDLISSIQSSELDPNAKPTQVASDFMFTKQFEFQIVNPGGIPYAIPGVATGVETDGTYIYFSYWQSDTLYRHLMDGTFDSWFVIPGVSAVRDLAYDGTYFYGSAATTSVFQMDFTPGSEALVSTITAPIAIRAIGYDDDSGFLFGNNWSDDIYIFDLTGATQSFFTPSANSYYGFAYDNQTTGGPYILGYGQINNMNELIQMNYPSGTETGLTFDVASVSTFWTTVDDIAGGVATTPVGTFVAGEATIIGAIQNISIWGLELDDPNPCSTPTALSATAAETSALLGWTETGTATTWDIELGLAGFTNTGTPTHPGVTTNPFEITGLTGLTSYDFYVRADCGGGSYSFWAGPYTFTTTCPTVVVDDATPLEEDFLTNVDPTCWTNTSSNPIANGLWEYGNATTNGMGYDATGTDDHTGNGGYFAWADGSTPVVADITMLSPLLDMTAVTTPYVEFYLFSYNVSYVAEGYCTFIADFWDGAAWNNLLTYSGSDPNWQKYGFDLSGYTITDDVQFRFIVDQTTATTAFYNDIALDDIFIGNMPSCPEPTGPATSNITATSALATWTAGGTEVMWNFEYGLDGFTLGTGTQIPVSENPQRVMNGLTADTDYDWYVQANCGGDVSGWVGPISFKTAPTDIIVGSGTATGQHLPIEPFYGYSYTQTIYSSTDLGTPGTGKQIDKIWYNYTWNGGDSDSDLWDIFMGTTTETTLDAGYLPITGFVQVFSGDLDLNLLSGTGWIEITLDNGFPYDPATDGNLVIAVHEYAPSYTSSSDEFFCDQNLTEANVSRYYYSDGTNPDPGAPPAGTASSYYPNLGVLYGDVPACPPPFGMAASNITGTSADLAWTSNSGTSNLEYGLSGFTLGTGTPVNGVTSPQTLTGLANLTDYDVYYQDDCGGGSLSTWSGPYTFTTACGALATPATEDFEGFTVATDATGYGPCWSTDPAGTTASYRWNVDAGGTPSSTTGPTVDHTTGTATGIYLFTEASSGAADDVASVYTPEYDLTGLTNPQVSFWYHRFGSTMGELHLDMTTDGGATWTLDVMPPLTGQQQAAQTDPYLEQVVVFPGLSGTVQFRFRAIRGSSYYGDMAIDDFAIGEGPSCPAPAFLGTQNMTSTTTELIWTSYSGLSNLEWGPAGFTPGTGTLVSGITSPYPLSGLTASTAYDFYVQDDCGGGDLSDWTMATFITPPLNDLCSNPEVVTGPYPVTGIAGTTIGATADCPVFLPLSSNPSGEVWYAIDLPYANNYVTLDIFGTLLDNGWIVGTDVQCSCDGLDYYYADSYNFAPPSVTDLAFENVPGPGTFYYPLATGTFQENFTLNVNVTEGPEVTVDPTTISATLVENQSGTDHLMVGNTGVYRLDYSASIAYPSPGGTNLLSDDFESGLGAWTVVDNGGTCVWDLDGSLTSPRGNLTPGTGDCATADSDRCGSGSTMDTELHSAVFDLSTFADAQLTFNTYYSDITTGVGTDMAMVDISIDGGTSWENILTWDEDHFGEFVTLSLLPYVGNANCVIRFHYIAPGWDWYWQIDDVSVDGYGSLLPPTGWLTLNGGDIASGSVAVGAPDADIMVGFDAVGIALGTYSADILLSTNDPVTPSVTIPVSMTVVQGIAAELTVLLEGPYDVAGAMTTELSTGGYIPLAQPYNPALPYYDNPSPKWLYSGTESVTAIPDGVVDWVLVQVRDAVDAASASSATIEATQAAFLMSDGSVVGLDGMSRLGFPGVTIDNDLFMVVYHRNHLGIMSANALTNPGGFYDYDFSSAETQVFGGANGHKLLEAGYWGMISSDGNGNGLVQNTDETAVWKLDLGGSGYQGGDFDMNGLTQNTDETNYWKPNLGGGGQVPAKSSDTGYQSQIPK